MISFIDRLTIAICIVGIFWFQGCFEGQTGFSGKVIFSNNREPASNISITVFQPDNCLLEECSKTETIKTDQDGKFNFSDFALEDAQIKINESGFEKVEKWIFKNGKQIDSEILIELVCSKNSTASICTMTLGTCTDIITKECFEGTESDCIGENEIFTEGESCTADE